jgi:hypothetical protein
VTDHRDRRDDTGRPEQQGRPRPYSAADLRARLDQLPESHPSSPRYRGGSKRAASLRELELSRADQPEESHGADRLSAKTARSGWDSPGVADHPDKPGSDAVQLADDRRQHILNGDTWGGGHRHGTGKEGKTEFPADWDDEQVSGVIIDVARYPDQPPVYQEWNSRWIVVGTRNNVEVSVVVQSDGRIWTAWPEEGSPGVLRNPKKGAP